MFETQLKPNYCVSVYYIFGSINIVDVVYLINKK